MALPPKVLELLAKTVSVKVLAIAVLAAFVLGLVL